MDEIRKENERILSTEVNNEGNHPNRIEEYLPDAREEQDLAGAGEQRNLAEAGEEMNRVDAGQETYKRVVFTEKVHSEREEEGTRKRADRKTNHKKNSTLQIVLIALVSSMVGASSVFAAFSIVPSAFGNNRASTTVSGSSGPSVTGVGTYKNVTIEQSNSPVTAIAEKVSPSVVGIKVTTTPQQSDFFFSNGGGTSEGSGIIISEDGYILTNNHVVEGGLTAGTNDLANGAKIEVILPNQKDKPYTATLVGRDTSSDLAVLKIQATGLPKADLGDSDKLKTGELAVAIGNPGGLDYMSSVTAGVISGLNRTLETDTGKDLHLIQTDAAINPGNSGGALCNSQGQVIGINTVKIAATGYEGLGFAIPINSAKQIAQDLINFKYVKGRPLLGLSIDQRFTSDVAAANNVPEGLLIADVTTYGPAQRAGIQVNDIITKFDGKAVKAFSDLDDQKNKHKPGDKVAVEVYRDGKTLTLTVTLGEQKI